MGLSANDAFAASGGGRRSRRRYGRGRRGTLSEINVTPLVDVMLVLLIIFMISAPLLTAGVPLELPKTEASAMQNESKPVSISIRADGTIFVQNDQVAFSRLSPRLKETVGDNPKRPIYVRADGRASYETVAQVMAALSTSGFSSINLITDTGGPSSGGDLGQAPPAQEPATR
ncbi:MAG TPA: biopolymer transporter ExbD [Phenylobacterium sp.]|uniref:ExbD/TolR family protein n=1 Tax=Phenylobacterium sp. TaxID=1871053 RepID=UPI002CBB7A32|nr:biopolymer transporter ExbD [Phenylobacterium sp.]HSV04264.1 biopolymer transporter ExbD [Phenylobacterium sp.]